MDAAASQSGVIMENIPQVQILKDRPQWICWRYEQRHGKSTKVPYDAKTPQKASCTNLTPKNCATEWPQLQI